MSNQPAIDSLYHWPICGNCAAGLSETDYEVGFCTQCGYNLINDDEQWEDDVLLQMDHELIREELTK